MDNQVIQVVADITCARDRETLDARLLVALARVLPIRSATLATLRNELGIEKHEHELTLSLNPENCTEPGEVWGEPGQTWDDEIRPYEIDPGVLDTISAGNTAVVRRDGEVSLVFPLSSDPVLASALELTGPEALLEHQGLCEGIVTIYGNFLKVLEDSQRDKLTGLLNRRTFDRRLMRMLDIQREIVEGYGGGGSDRRTRADTEYAWLAIIDIDHFKRVNDNHGHLYGDEVIITVGRMMQKFFRNTDLLFRFGGEEFIVVLEPMPIESARRALDRFRGMIADEVFKQIGGITVSLGFSRLEQNDYPPEVIDRADKALYYAKQNGRNRVENYEDLVENGLMEASKLEAGQVELF